MRLYISLLLTIIVLGSCEKYEPTFGTEFQSLTANKGIAVIVNDQWYMMDQYGKEIQLQSSQPLAYNRKLRLSHDYSKIAYINTQNQIVIMDNSGNVEAALSQYPNAVDIGWTHDDETLYILENNQLYFYGSNPDISNSPLYNFPSSTQGNEILGVAINSEGEVASAYQYTTFSQFGGGYTYYHGIAITKKSGSQAYLEDSDPFEFVETYTELRSLGSSDFKAIFYDDENNYRANIFYVTSNNNVERGFGVADFEITGLLSTATFSPDSNDQLMAISGPSQVSLYIDDGLFTELAIALPGPVAAIDWK